MTMTTEILIIWIVSLTVGGIFARPFIFEKLRPPYTPLLWFIDTVFVDVPILYLLWLLWNKS